MIVPAPQPKNAGSNSDAHRAAAKGAREVAVLLDQGVGPTCYAGPGFVMVRNCCIGPPKRYNPPFEVTEIVG
jgi:hypothetical protein